MKINVKNKTPDWAILLRDKRKIKRINQTFLAKKIGVSAMALSFFESGKRFPRIDIFEKWCSKLGFEVIINPTP